MDSNLSFLPASPLLPSVIDSTGSAIGSIPLSRGGEFSALLTGQMLKAGRQLFAAQALDGTGLQVLPLGPKIKLITSDGPLPDMASLAAFARTQGIDEAAVQALFADQNIPASALLLTQPVNVQFGLRNTPEFPPGSLASAQQTPTSSTPSRPEEMLALAAEPSPGSPALLMPPGQGAAEPFNIAPPRVDSPRKELTVSKDVVEPSPGNPEGLMQLNIAATSTSTSTTAISIPTEDVTALETASPMLTNSSIASWMPLNARAWVDASEATNAGAASSEMDMQDAVRLTIGLPIQAVTKRLTQMSGSSEQSTWATLLAGNTLPPTTLSGPKAWESLQLDIPDDLLTELLDRPQESLDTVSFENSPRPGMGEATTSTSPGPSQSAKSDAPNLSAQVEQRFIHQQQLADKLGQALAQRLIEQMERGQWKLQMRLQPENLGQIEVELKMHADGLDALFSAENAVTRELIAQGSGKLKEALAQTGMAVASVWVNGDQSRQSGGNSTPGNRSKVATGAVTRKPDGVEDVVASVKDRPTATDRLNIWA
jgi:flagellar hook-length control protein FliK